MISGFLQEKYNRQKDIDIILLRNDLIIKDVEISHEGEKKKRLLITNIGLACKIVYCYLYINNEAKMKNVYGPHRIRSNDSFICCFQEIILYF